MSTNAIIEKVYERFVDLAPGKHDKDRGPACIMELISWATGGPWTDIPDCVAPDIALLCASIHDYADPADYDRIWTIDRLTGILAAPIGREHKEHRACLAAEYFRPVVTAALSRQGMDISHVNACAPVRNRATALALFHAYQAIGIFYAPATAAAVGAAYAAASYSAACYAAYTLDKDAEPIVYSTVRNEARVRILDHWLGL